MTERDKPEVQIVKVAEVDSAESSAFFVEAFGASRGGFLIRHGDWWHRDPDRRVLLICDGAIAGCWAGQPMACLLNGRELHGTWGMDLYLLPRFRGRGLQGLLDRTVFLDTDTRMGFPNQVAAGITARHGSRVREDLRVLGAPLRPCLLDPVREASGGRGALLRAGASGLSPLAALLRERASRYRPRRTEIADSPDVEVLERLFRRTVTREMGTILRDSDFLCWRYLQAPYRSELDFYLTGPQDSPTHYGVVRRLVSGDSIKVRILDLFGDLSDSESLVDLLRSIVRDAVIAGAKSVTCVSCSPELTRVSRAAGLVWGVPWRFNWRSKDPWIQEGFSRAALHWTLADADSEFQN